MPKEQATTGRLPRPAAPGDPSPTGEGSVNAKSGPPYRPTLEWHTTDPDHWDKLKPEVQRMRGAPTDAEAVLWNALRRGGVGIHFRRQHVIDRFVVDFCSLAAKVVVEVDGAIHNNQEQRDAERDERLKALGFQVLRFPNESVFNDLARVLTEIRKAIPAAP